MAEISYYLLYLVSFASVVLVVFSIANEARRRSVNLGPGRLASLTRDETFRLKSGDPVYLMHLSIALGVGLSILLSLIDPLLGILPLLPTIFLLVSVPILLGLAAAFAWRVS